MFDYLKLPEDNYPLVAVRQTRSTVFLKDFFNLLGCHSKDGFSEQIPGTICDDIENISRKGYFIYKREDFNLVLLEETKTLQWGFSCTKDSYFHKHQVFFWELILLNALIPPVHIGHRLAIVHGALLELEDGRGIFLSAESGVGKSTTCRRWEACGGKYTSDDMILLEYDTPDGVIAHPLPTWSRCIREGTAHLCYPLQRRIPLVGMLVLSRAEGDEPERIVEMPWAEFLCQVYQSVCYFHQKLIRRFPEPEQHQIIANYQACARKLCSVFPPRALRARLDGDLRETLKEFL